MTEGFNVKKGFNAKRDFNAKLQGREGTNRAPSTVAMFSRFQIFASLRLWAFALILSSGILAQGLPSAAPNSVGMNGAKLSEIDALVNADIAAGNYPGAVVVIGHKGKIVYRKAFGNRALQPSVEPISIDTIYDVASLTKVVATTTSIMMLVEQGKLRLNDTVGKYFPEIEDEQAKKVTIQQLLTHVSGYAPDFDLGQKWTGSDGMIAALKIEKLRNPTGTKFVYSDINFEILGEIVHKVSGKMLDVFAREIFERAKMNDSRFIAFDPGPDGMAFNKNVVSPELRRRIAPTENVKGQNSYLGSKFEGGDAAGNEILRGQVHDPTAFRMGGVAGHAGLFSTADDLARFAQMLLNGGTIDGTRILSAATIARMTAPVVVSETGQTRGLGWDIDTGFSSNRGELFPHGSFGHTGFTGPSIWIDRVTQTFVIFMSNRVHPDGKGSVGDIRAKVATIAASAVEDTPIEAIRLAEAAYFSQVAAQLPGFIKSVENARLFSRLTFGPGLQRPPTQNDRPVLNGIDVLKANGFKELAGKRVGLVTNHTGRDLDGKQTIDILFGASNVKLVALFAPEHGIRGELDQENISDTKDAKTGLPVYSLYGETRRPKPEQLEDLDAIVYDIQDIGARFYTYTATLKNVLEEAAKAKKPVYILDRPNPIRGDIVEGPLAQEDKLSFIAAHTIPVRYGLTIGELGLMMNAERKIGADVHVIQMQNWRRSMWFDETGQTWINPSPNMRSLTEATLYPGIGLLETTNVSVGRGTDTPFEVVAAPWIDGRELTNFLNRRNLAGVRFVSVSFTPNASVFKGVKVNGINIIITDRARFDSVNTGFEIAAALRKLYPNDWEADKYARLLVNADYLDMVKRGDTAAAIEKKWAKDVADFRERSKPFLLYE